MEGPERGNRVAVAQRSHSSLAISLEGSEEQRLVEAARALSPEAWSSIYDTNFPKIYSYIYRRVENHAVAEDLASHVFVEALQGIGRFQYRGVSLLAWLYRIAHNLTCDHMRRDSASVSFPWTTVTAITTRKWPTPPTGWTPGRTSHRPCGTCPKISNRC